MKDIRCQNTFERMSNGMAKIDQVAQTSLFFVDRDDVRFDSYRTVNDGEEKLLSFCTSGSCSTCSLTDVDGFENC